MRKDLQTVKRRCDWVTACGLVIFVLVMLLEIITAAGVPVIMRRDGLFAEEIMRNQLNAQFDSMRRRISNAMEKTPDEANKSELLLISFNANFLADYLRANIDQMSAQDLITVTDRVKRMNTNVLHNIGGTSATGRIELDMSGVIRELSTQPEER